MVQEKKGHKKSKRKPSAMAQVHNRVNAGVMDGVVYGGMMEESQERFETWYRGYKAKYGSDHDHLLWLTDDIDYARSYGNRVEEVILDGDRLNSICVSDLFDDGVDYLDGPSKRACKSLTAEGYNCYYFEANHDSSYCMCLWDKSAIVSRRELSREEFDSIEGYEGYDNPGYDVDLNEAAEPEDEEYEIGMEEDGLEPYGHVIDESTDSVTFGGGRLTCYDYNAVPFISFIKKDGSRTRMFVGVNGELHSTMPAALLSNGDIKKDDFGSLWDIKRDEERSGRVWITEDCTVISFYSYPESIKKIYDFCVEALLAVQEATGKDFNIGETMVDLWTKNVRNPIIMPVRWFNNGTAEIFLPITEKCEPYENFDGTFRYRLSTSKGNFTADWKGDDIEQEEEYGALRESKEMANKVDYNKYIKSLIEFMREQHLRIDPLPEIELNPEKQDGIFVKTGYYSPEERKVVVFTDGRHPKDVLRTVAHEFIHHMQNLQNPDKDWGTGGDLEADRKLRGIEGEAFLLGNIIFREWTEKMRKTRELNESKKKKQVKNDEGELVPETCDKCGGKVVCQIHGEPVYVCKDCGKYFGTMPCNLNEAFDVKKALKKLKKRRDPANIENWNRIRIDEIETEIIEPDDVDLSSFNIKKHLNPKFWDDGHLDTRIRLKLLDIADDFFHFLGVDWVEPEDIIITGSLANYNWNKKYSDIDLHILIDYEDVDERVDFVREYFTMKKNEWNEKHKNLRIFGFPVEVYVQDANEPHASSGVYSVDRDEWLTEPDLDNLRSGKVDKRHVREMVSTYMNKIDDLVDIYKRHKDDEYEMRKVSEDAARMFDEIKKTRKDDLTRYGREMCDGNIIFKALRRSDYIGKLIKLKNLTYDKINSL